MNRAGLLAASLILTLYPWRESHAWIFPEHRDIGTAAITSLDKNDRTRLAALWSAANPLGLSRLCAQPSEPGDVPERGGAPCADLAMLSALAGDHSCSPEDMENAVLRSSWFPKVAVFSWELKHDLRAAKDRETKLNVLNASNSTLLNLDADLYSRAVSNLAHFPLEAEPVREREQLDGFVDRSLRADAPKNAVAAYARNHLAALQYARLGMAREAVMTEAFALHFLQDLFSAGHYAGTWGDTSERKGTHDYYCENGLVTQTWGDRRYSGHGDAFMGADDIQHASDATRESLEQLVQAYSPEGAKHPAVKPPDAFSREVCSASPFGDSPKLDSPERKELNAVLSQTPIPSEGKSGVSVPRFRIEIGPFVSVSSGARFGATSHDSTVKRFEILGRLGLGTTGVLSDRSDGAMFVEFGFVADGDQQSDPTLSNRGGQRFGLRTPFWIFPGDMLFLAPFFYFTGNQTALQNVAISASNGGLLGLEQKIGLPFGTLQLIAGRQFALSLFGYLWNDAPLLSDSNGTTIGTYRSIELDFPLVELKATHTFATKLAFDTTLQFGYALEIPKSSNPPGLQDSSIVYLRLSLEALQY